MLYETVYPQLTSTYKLGLPSTKFFIWKKKIEFIFVELGIKYVLTTPKPLNPADVSSATDTNLFEKWMADDARCQHIMLCATTDETFELFCDCLTAKDMMNAMHSCFVATSTMQKLNLFNKYRDCKMLEESKVMDHVLKMSSLARDLKEGGWEKVDNDMQIAILSNSLPDSWQPFADNILIKCKEEMSLFDFISLLRQEEEVRAWRARGEKESEVEQKKKKGKCYICDEQGHHQNECPDRWL